MHEYIVHTHPFSTNHLLVQNVLLCLNHHTAAILQWMIVQYCSPFFLFRITNPFFLRIIIRNGDCWLTVGDCVIFCSFPVFCCIDWWLFLLILHGSALHHSLVPQACSIFERFGHSESEEPNVANEFGSPWLHVFWGIWRCIWSTIHIYIYIHL